MGRSEPAAEKPADDSLGLTAEQFHVCVSAPVSQRVVSALRM